MTKLERAFWEFHREHPEVYDLFERFAAQVIQRGHQHYSADAILHRVRWHTSVDVRDREGFKINNNFSAYYARLWLENHPSRDGFFQTRALACERRAA